MPKSLVDRFTIGWGIMRIEWKRKEGNVGQQVWFNYININGLSI